MVEQTDADAAVGGKGVDFVFYTVDDFSTAVSFYRDTLGLTAESVDEEMGWAEFAAPPTTFAVGEATAEMPFTPGSDGTGIALAVDDVENTTARLERADVEIRMEPVESPVCHMSAIADPSGNIVLLHERKDGTHGRRDPFQSG